MSLETFCFPAWLFLLFVEGYKDAEFHLRKFEVEALPAVTHKEFIIQFQKLVCLDYIIRNTGKYNNLLCNIKQFYKIQSAAKSISIISYISIVKEVIIQAPFFTFPHLTFHV